MIAKWCRERQDLAVGAGSAKEVLAQSEGTPPPPAIVNTATRGVDWEAAIRAARANNIPVLAFGSHMDLDARARAVRGGRGEGCG